ncbi:MAG: prepilin-type N-terminal cleavage/methylation domain-containing protein [Candidatus Omnitrophota bacterium]
MRQNGSAFSLIELIIAVLVLSIVVAVVYSAFTIIVQLGAFPTYKIEAHKEAAGWLNRVVGEIEYNNANFVDSAGAYVDLNDASSVLAEDSSVWPMSGRADVTMNSAQYEIEENVDLGSGEPFKRVKVKIDWDVDY